MAEPIPKVGMREFRAHLPQYVRATSPVAITRHGETIGYYVPARPTPQQAEREALKAAAARLDALFATHGLTEEELVAEFRRLREGERT
ncbi:MAG: prevent-host-death protein [Nitrococcus sp.]|nr:prevent-host-death protein [Nitrococcus sp.]